MSVLTLELDERRDRLGLKGPRAAEWLAAQGVALPAAANTWTETGATRDPDAAAGVPVAGIPAAGVPVSGAPVLAARLGAAEFFLEDAAGGTTIRRMAASVHEHPPGVYPVLREDWAFQLGGDGVHDVLAQVCNVNFAALALESRPVIMTLMIGVAVLVVPRSAAGGRDYRIWCDPTFGPYLNESLGAVVSECGGRHRGVSQ